MKIYSRQEFMNLPEGVIFAKGKPWFFGELSVKGDTIKSSDGRNIDFSYMGFVWVDGNNSSECFNSLEDMKENDASYPMQDGYSRDGCFDEEDLFLVYEANDIRRMIGFLEDAP